MEKVNEMITVQEAKTRKKNKGFSLVELIVVIAIMAILVGIVGTQVLPYIEKSREAKDEQILSALCTASLTSFAQNAAALDNTKKYGITSFVGAADAKTEHLTADTAASAAVIADFKTLSGYDALAEVKAAMESKKGKDIASIRVVYSATDGSLELTAYDGATTPAIVFKTMTAK
ncbi:type II secretion system protein [Anaerocolumna xylanovorans]|uniref:Prepilin-type N-terminal cleavage/methylation domain-containing protein n=1 Tax=Anaerocolumna xylanovorans DSM 12503 TaxID=1121345 RepID=A0A1M7YMY9_9FIRM|nr:type II secretion system protein [Anaerocolumna xylanovorans]SHO53942.1 prepilin-type N-terminal cleavage/methylation domain-containing protein [Anaerocolumna xylanovorans DSM 12503]